MKVWILSLLIAAYASAQIPQPRMHDMLLAAQPEVTAVWAGYPTNQSDCYAWWSADNGWNAAGMVWTNYCLQATNSETLNLTNKVSGKAPTLVANFVNGHAALWFDGSDDYMCSALYNVPQPHVLWFVVARTNAPGALQLLSDGGPAGTGRNVFGFGAAGGWDNYAGGTETSPGTRPPDNGSFYSVCAVFNTNRFTVATNGVDGGNNPATGTQGAIGITIGSRYSFDNYRLKGYVAEILTFTNTQPASTISNLHAYFKQKYSLAGP